MKLTKIAGDCPDKVTCPAAYATDRGTIVVQGNRVTDPDALAQVTVPDHETLVEIPATLWRGPGVVA